MASINSWFKILEETECSIPLELQSATVWLFNNIEIIDQMLKVSYMPENVRQDCMKQAKAKHEHRLWILLMYQKFIQEHREPSE